MYYLTFVVGMNYAGVQVTCQVGWYGVCRVQELCHVQVYARYVPWDNGMKFAMGIGVCNFNYLSTLPLST